MKRRVLSPFAITQLLMAAVVGSALWLAYWPWRWGQMKDEVRLHFPSVKRIDGTMLQKWMAERSVAPPVLLDVRSPAEFEASHLPGARRVVIGAPLTENQLGGFESAQVVVYDTVGFDAASFADELLRQKFADVQVLEGGIYLWANERRPLIGLHGPAGRVLPGAPDHVSLLDHAHRTK